MYFFYNTIIYNRGVIMYDNKCVRCTHEGINYYLLKFSILHSGTKTIAAFSSATQHAMPLKTRQKGACPAVCRIQRDPLHTFRLNSGGIA